MGDYVQASLTIGGLINEDGIKRLSEAIAAQGVAADWGDRALAMRDAETLIREVISRQECVLLYDNQANYGNMDEITTACLELGLFYELQYDAGCEFSAGLNRYDPGIGREREAVTGESIGAPLIEMATVKDALHVPEKWKKLIDEINFWLSPIPPLGLVG